MLSDLKKLHLRKLNWLECGAFRLHDVSIFEVSEAFVSGCFSDSAGTRQFADLDLRTCRRESKWLNTFSLNSLFWSDTFLQLPGTKVTMSNTFWLVYDPSKFPWVYFFNYFHFKWCCSTIKPVSHTRCPHQWCPCRCPPLHPCGHDASVWRWSPGCRCWTASVPFSDCWCILARQVRQCLSALAWNMITHYKQYAC